MAHVKDDILIKKIALCIKKIRSETDISLDDFYVDTGIHLARIERGKTNITIATLSKICDYFQLSLKDFFQKLEEI